MACFLRARTTGLHGMRLPIRDDADPLDSEYADDTALYVQDDIESLEQVRLSLEVFCLAAGAKINWHKSIGFLTEPGASSQWGIFLGFRWIPRGQATRYLGFQVRLDTTPAQQFLPVLLPFDGS